MREFFEIMILGRAVCVIYNSIFKKCLRAYFGIIDQPAQLPLLQSLGKSLRPCHLSSHSQPCGFRNMQPWINLIYFADRWAGSEDRGLGKWGPHETSTQALSPQAWGGLCGPRLLNPTGVQIPHPHTGECWQAPTWKCSLTSLARMLGQPGEPLG